jgi:hypothetical protein
MARFTCTRLDSARKEIKLVRLLPGLFDTGIQVEIVHEKLSEGIYPPGYEALSYAWGSTDDPETIAIAYRNELSEPARAGESSSVSVLESSSPDSLYETLQVSHSKLMDCFEISPTAWHGASSLD